MKNKLKCPHCKSYKIRTQICTEKSISINENGICEFGKKVIDEKSFSLACNRLYCGKCFKSLKFTDGMLLELKE